MRIDVPLTAALSSSPRPLPQFNRVYAQAFNRCYGLVGHVLQDRFKAIVVDWDSYLLE